MALQMLSCLRLSGAASCSSILLRSCAGAKTSAASTITSLPERPKKPITGYISFVTEMIPKLVTDAGRKMTGKEAVTRASQLWKQLPIIDRQKYNDRFMAEREKYQAALVAFEARLTPQARAQLMQAERQKKLQRAETARKRQMKLDLVDLGRPKRPPVSFMLFLMSELKKNPDRGGRRMTEFTREMGQRWSAMSDQDKSVFQLKSAKLREQYEDKLEKWERRMISEGRSDLVRGKSQPVILEPARPSKPSKQ